MAVSWGTGDFPGLRIDEKLFESARTLVYRSHDEGGRSVVLKVLRAEYPRPEVVARFHQEYEIAHALELPHVIHASRWGGVGRTPFIVFEDVGGRSLRQLMPARDWPVERILDVAIALADALAELHAHRVIHKDVNPSNVVYNPETGALKLIDLGISSVLSTESPQLANPEVIEGTLAYISPEQSGRMNRVLDHRTDFYSLGVTLYELATGAPPFAGGDALELVHRHLSQAPVPAHEREPRIPRALSEIIGKLLAKAAEDRYQSAWGLRADLLRCREALTKDGHIEPFPLAREDVPERFHLPQKLYGRAAELAVLNTAWEEVSRGGRALLLVAGHSGIGKTCLVQELWRPLTKRRGYFVSGKFDQVRRNIPYSAVVQAFQSLARQLLTEREERLLDWRTRLLEALGSHGQIIIDVIPEVELIIGPQPPVPELPPVESRNRFNLTFQKFVGVFYRADHPLVVFLDDLQWADAATLGLLELLMLDDDTRHLLVIGAYRDNEVGAAHPLALTIESLAKRGAPPRVLPLADLGADELKQLVADALYCNRAEAAPLAELVLHKTGGNPFFVGQFLTTLSEERLIRFEAGDGATRPRWQWDVARIREAQITDNVVELVLGKLKRLPEATIQVLRLAACLGNRFELETLALVRERSLADTHADLFPAIQEGMVLPLSGLELTDAAHPEAPLVFARFKFLHDRVQQAAYALVPDELKPALHLQIGRLLRDRQGSSGTVSAERLFELAGHLNLGRALMTTEEERLMLARLDLEAARRAKSAAAHGPALRYLAQGMEAFPGDWEREYALTLALYKERAELEYMNGRYDVAERHIETIWAEARVMLDRAEALAQLVTQFTMLGENDKAIAAAARGLGLLGMGFPPSDELAGAVVHELAEIEHGLGGRTVASLIDLPALESPEVRVAMKLLMTAHTPVYFANRYQLYCWVLARMTNLSIRYGNVPESSKGYASFGNTLAANWGRYEQGYEFGLLGLRLAERYGDEGLTCKACLILSMFLNHWVRPMAEADAFDQLGQRVGLESGELQFTGYILAYGRTINQVFRGENLDVLLAATEQHLAFTRRTRHHLSTDIILGARLVLSHLAGATPDQRAFELPELDEARYLAGCTEHGSFAALANFHTLKAYALYLVGELALARQSLEAARPLLGYVRGTLIEAEHVFHDALVFAAEAEAALDAGQGSISLAPLDEALAWIENWASHCPDTFGPMQLLVSAERARLCGRGDEALTLYDRAIERAAAGGFVQHEALTHERVARYWLSRGKGEFALVHLRRARLGYRAWGAVRKEMALVVEHPALAGDDFDAERPRGPDVFLTSRTTAARLDLSSVLKASQALSSELVLDRLVDRLLRVVLENAGAERGKLILRRNNRLVLSASIAAAAAHAERFDDTPLEDAEDLPRLVVQYVARTSESVVLHDAAVEDAFSDEPYPLAGSVLCTPLLHRGELVGVLYLEHRRIAGLFSPERIEVLRLLSSQAAISLENALLLEGEQAARRAAEDAEQRAASLAQHNAELYQQEQHAVRMRDEFIMLASHELKTPLTTLMLQNSMLRRQAEHLPEAVGPQREGLIAMAERGVQQIDSLVHLFERLLDVSAVGARPTLVRERLDLVDAVRDTVRRQGPASQRAGCEISVAADGPVEGLWDRIRLEQVVGNLLANAIKYGAGRPVELTVSAQDGMARLEVRDHGIGIAPADQVRIFERYERTSTARFYGGLGIGLYIAREIVAAHGGSIRVESEEGAGATFIVELPQSGDDRRAAP